MTSSTAVENPAEELSSSESSETVEEIEEDQKDEMEVMEEVEASEESDEDDEEVLNDGEINLTKMKHDMIQTLAIVFSKGNKNKKLKKPRNAYIEDFVKFVTQYYDYNEFLADRFFQIFGREVMDALDANEDQRPLTIRPNFLKTNRSDLINKLVKKNVKITQSELSKIPIIVKDSAIPIGATTEYLCGLYMIQGIASLMPVIALSPKPDTKVLDLCAAPGGKTAFISAFMKNTGMLFANDSNKERCKSVFANIHRMGCQNVIICSQDGRKFMNYVKAFDSVLVDAPCSGTGVISKDKAAKKSKNSTVIAKCADLQKELLSTGIQCCKNGGHIVYSTCSVMPEENEQVIDHVIRKYDVKIVDTGITVGEPGFTNFKNRHFKNEMALSKRFYPHLHDVDGFYVCKLLKISDNKRNASSITKGKDVENKEVSETEDEKEASDERKIAEIDDKSLTSLNFKQGEKSVKVKKHKKKMAKWKQNQIKNMRKKDFQKAIERNKKK